MAIILKPVFEILTGDIAICDNIIYNYIFLWAVGKIAYHLAYSSVGELYDSGAINSSLAGSVTHWIIRLPVYILAAYLLRILILLHSFIASIPVQTWWILFGAFTFISFIFIVYRITKRTQPAT